MLRHVGCSSSLAAGGRHGAALPTTILVYKNRSQNKPSRCGDASAVRTKKVARQAERKSLSHERYLHELIQRECKERQENRISKMLREAQLPRDKTLDAFDEKASG